MKGAHMNMYESIINALARMAEHNLNEAMILEACLGFTVDKLQNAEDDTYFKELFGGRLHYLIRDIIDHIQ